MRVAQFILFILIFASHTAFADWQMNLTPGVTPVSHDIYGLHMTIFWICVVIGIGVFGVMFYSMIYHRKSRGVKAAHFHEHLWVELAWTFIPLIILIVIAIPATKVLIHMNDESEPDITIKITGRQWKWEYTYLDQGIHFFSNLATPYAQLQNKAPKDITYLRHVDHPLVVPIHKKIRFLITSGDVIHAWFVPELGVQRDGIPGFINESWTRINRAGTYYGQCNKLCGINHAYMPIVVNAVSEAEFEKWVAQNAKPTTPKTQPTNQSTTSSAPILKSDAANTTAPSTIQATTQQTTPSQTASTQQTTPSQTTSTQQATSSNNINNSNQQTTSPITTTSTANSEPATNKLTLADLMKQGEQVYLNTCSVCHQATGEGMPPTFPSLKGDNITLDAHLNRVLNGKPGTAMQAFRDQLSDEDIAAVITYERNAWGNNKGDTVQPDQVKAVKAKPPTGN